jgi:hypothetical protein
MLQALKRPWGMQPERYVQFSLKFLLRNIDKTVFKEYNEIKIIGGFICILDW